MPRILFHWSASLAVQQTAARIFFFSKLLLIDWNLGLVPHNAGSCEASLSLTSVSFSWLTVMGSKCLACLGGDYGGFRYWDKSFSIFTGFSMLSVCAISNITAAMVLFTWGEGALGPWVFGSPRCQGETVCLMIICNGCSRVVAWNVRGLNSEFKSSLIFDYIKKYKPLLILLQETHFQGSRVFSLKRVNVAGAYHASFSSYAGGGFYTGH